MAIKTILIDDEPLALMEMEATLQAYSDLQIVATAQNATDAKNKIEEHNPDLIFLDINMPGKSGFDLLQEIEEVPVVVFVTAYDEYAIKAFEVNALDYLLKPVNNKRLNETIEKVRKQVSQQKSKDHKLHMDKRIFIKDGEHCFFVPLAEVFLIESVGNYARFYYQHHKPLLHKSLTYLEERLPDMHFFRAGRQHIINVNFIKNIHPYFNSSLQAELHNGMKIDISQRQSVKFKELMGI